MTIAGWLQIATYCLVLLILTRPTGLYITRVMETGGSPLEPALGPLERLIYRLAGVDADKEMRWTGYALALLAFSMISMLFTYALLRLQGFLPLNPMGFSTPSAPAWATAMTADLAFNTAASFTTNTTGRATAARAPCRTFRKCWRWLCTTGFRLPPVWGLLWH